MARARIIKPGFFTNAALSEVPAHGRLLFIGLWTIADRKGRLKDEPRWIKGAIFPYETVPVEKLLQQLHIRKFINRYEVEGQRFIEIVNFLKHQTPNIKEQASTIPAPDEHSTSTVFSDASTAVTVTVYGNGNGNGEGSGTAPPSLDLPPSYPSLKSSWENRIGFLPTADRDEFIELAAAIPLAWFTAAIEETASVDHPSWAYCRRILTTCRDEQRPPSSIRKAAKPEPISAAPSLRYRSAT